MRLLLSNDDGIGSEGLAQLTTALSQEHEVWIVAPDTERSGSSHSMSIKGAVRVIELGPRRYACEGSPVDCVILAFHGLLPFVPDAVIAGINRGPNLGTDIVYSGTASIARQAALYGVPGIAFSLSVNDKAIDFRPAASRAALMVPRLAASWSYGMFYNVNFPPGNLEGAVETDALPCKRRYLERIDRFDAPDSSTYWFFSPCTMESEGSVCSDARIVEDGGIAVSSIVCEPCVVSERHGVLAGMA